MRKVCRVTPFALPLRVSTHSAALALEVPVPKALPTLARLQGVLLSATALPMHAPELLGGVPITLFCWDEMIAFGVLEREDCFEPQTRKSTVPLVSCSSAFWATSLVHLLYTFGHSRR